MKTTRALLACLLLVFAVSLHADEDCAMAATLKNKTGGKLKLSTATLQWGKWCVGPPHEIPNGGEAYFRACGRSASWSGTQGTLAYTLEGTYSTVQFVFDSPWGGEIKYDIKGTNAVTTTMSDQRCDRDGMCKSCRATVTAYQH